MICSWPLSFLAKIICETRRRAPISVAREHEAAQKCPRESKAIPAPDANAELQASIQVIRWFEMHLNTSFCVLKLRWADSLVSFSEKYIPEENGGSGFRIEPPKEATQMASTALGSSQNTNWNQRDNLRGLQLEPKVQNLENKDLMCSMVV